MFLYYGKWYIILLHLCGVYLLNLWWDPSWMWDEKTSFFGTPRIPKTKSFSFKRFMLKSGPRAIVNKQFLKKKKLCHFYGKLENRQGMFSNCFFLLVSIFKNNFLFLWLKNLFDNPKWTKNKNRSQNSICKENWKHAKCCFHFSF